MHSSCGRTLVILLLADCTQRELNGKYCPLTWLSAKCYSPTMLFNETLGHPESEPGSHIALGGEERVEDARFQLSGDSTSSICKRYLCVLRTVLENGLAMYLNEPLIRRGIDSIGDEVGKDLPHFAAQCLNLQPALDVDLRLDRFVAKFALENSQHIVNGIPNTYRRHCRCIAIEPQRLLSDMADSLKFSISQRQIFFCDWRKVLGGLSEENEVRNRF